MSMREGRWWIVGLLLIGSVGLAADPRKAPPVSVPVEEVQEIQENGAKKYIGTVEPIEDVTVRARVDGVLEKIAFIEGAMVKEGDILFEIEKDIYLAQEKAAEARVAQLNADLIYAEQNYTRQKDLSKDKLIAKRDLEEAERRFNFTKAQFAEAEYNLVIARQNLKYSTITAPITGQIGKSAYSRGNYLTAQSSPLATIAKVAPIYVTFAVSERDLLSIFGSVEKAKELAVVRVKPAGRTDFDEVGKITLADNRIDPQTGTLKMWATFANVKQMLTPGAVLDVIISSHSNEKRPAVKITAIMTNKGGQFVYVVKDDNTADLRQIEVGETIGDLQVVTYGLKAGEKVIIDGAHKIAQGATIIPAGK